MKKGCLIAIGVFFLLGIIGSMFSDDEKEQSKPKVNSKENVETKNENTKTKWVYSEYKDEMTEKVSYFASITSDNSVDFEFPYNGGSDLKITVRKDPKYGKDVYFQISKGQFANAVLGGKISVKFDDGEIETYNCNGADDGSGDILFLTAKLDTFISKLKKSNKIKIQASFFQEGDRTFTFSTPVGLVWEH